MRLRDKLILSGLVLATGVSGAWWFRKSGEAPRSVEASGEHLVLREEYRPNAPPDPTAQTPGGTHPVPVPVPGSGEKTPAAPQPFDGDDKLPSLAPNFQPAFNIRSPRTTDKSGSPVPPLTPLTEPRRDLQSTSSSPFPPLARNVSPAPGDAEQAVTHRVVDGDTLARLAEMYLGNSSRRLEIFEANRGLLKDPEILPIGAEIKIPPRNPAVPVSDANAPQPLVPLHHGEK